MKKTTLPLLLAGTFAIITLNGCVAAIGNRDAKGGGTLGQQLVDLKKAHDSGALSDQEYQTEKDKLLHH